MPHTTNSWPACARIIPAAASLLFALSSVCHAAELGNIRVHSWIGHQLKASVPLAGDDARASEARCFKASLVNLRDEAVGNLKVTLQHSSRESLLLLVGGNAVDEPAATVRVENVCGLGERRDYAVLLDRVPEAQIAAATPVAAPAGEAEKRETGTSRVPAPASGVRAAVPRREAKARPLPILLPEFLFEGLKMSAMLADPAGGRNLPPPLEMAEAVSLATSFNAALKLDRSLAGVVPAASAVRAKADQDGSNARVAGGLSLLAALGALAWLALRVRAMRSAGKPWFPVDTPADAGSGEGTNQG